MMKQEEEGGLLSHIHQMGKNPPGSILGAQGRTAGLFGMGPKEQTKKNHLFSDARGSQRREETKKGRDTL